MVRYFKIQAIFRVRFKIKYFDIYNVIHLKTKRKQDGKIFFKNTKDHGSLKFLFVLHHLYLPYNFPSFFFIKTGELRD